MRLGILSRLYAFREGEIFFETGGATGTTDIINVVETRQMMSERSRRWATVLYISRFPDEARRAESIAR